MIVEGGALPFRVYLECKHITKMSKNRINDVIKHADLQFKRAEAATGQDAYGVALLDVTGVVGLRRTEGNERPEALAYIESEVGRVLSGDKNSHVKIAIVVWDDFQSRGGLPQPRMTFFRRNSLAVSHKNQVANISSHDLFEGFTVAAVINTAPD